MEYPKSVTCKRLVSFFAKLNINVVILKFEVDHEVGSIIECAVVMRYHINKYALLHISLRPLLISLNMTTVVVEESQQVTYWVKD